jgi:hypothetical protein
LFVVKVRGQHLDQVTKKELISKIRRISGLSARKCPLTIRLLELLHTQPEIWMPFKELSLPDRIQNVATMNSDELRNMLTQLSINLNPAEFTQWESNCKATQEAFARCFEVLSQLLPLVLPTVEVDPAEITWAFTVVQTRSMLTDEEVARGSGTGQLVPLFDMLNHSPAAPTCNYAPPSSLIGQGIRAMLAVQADPVQLSVDFGPDGAALLARGGRPLGRLDDCLIVTASSGGLRAGEEARLRYHDPPELSQEGRMMFALTYGFDPAK